MYLITIIVTLITFKYVNCLHTFGLQYRNIQHVELDSSVVSEDWIDQPLDHFTPGSASFRMRFFRRLDLWKPNGPAYIFLGGEGTAETSLIQFDTVMTQLARETNGALFATEHRFYGMSVPANPQDVLQFLSSLQALEDLANFIKYLKSTGELSNSKVVVVGASYSGNLAAWARLRYPGLVDAALAISAPVLAKTDFYEYLETVNDVYKQYGTPGCLEKIQQIFSRYAELLKTKSGREQLKREYNINEYIDLSLLVNQQDFLYNAMYIYMGNVQTGTPYSIKQHCANISQTNVLSVPAFPFEMRNNLNFRSSLHSMMALPDSSMTMWSYQVCTEFGYFMTTSSEKQPFGNLIDVDYCVKTCTRLFGPQFNKDRVEQGVASTNYLYGGLRPNVTKVIFTHGDMDPWHRLGVVASQSDSVIAITTPGTSHCAIIYQVPVIENPQLTKDREYVKSVIKKWIA